MLYVVKLTYVRPLEEVNAHLDTHRDWLVEHTRGGRIIAAGPMEDRTGGIVLANCGSREELDGMLTQDSFHVHSLVSYEISGFTAALRASEFSEKWAANAKAV